ARFTQAAGELRRRRQMQVREQHLPRAEPGDLRRERLLDLQNELGAPPDVVDRDELGADRRVFLVPDSAPDAGAALDDHAVCGLDQRSRAGRSQRDALLARLDLTWDPDDHRASFAAARREPRKSRISRLTRSGCSCTTQCEPSGIRSIVRSGTKRSSPTRFPVRSASSRSPQITKVDTRTIGCATSPPRLRAGAPSPPDGPTPAAREELSPPVNAPGCDHASRYAARSAAVKRSPRPRLSASIRG